MSSLKAMQAYLFVYFSIIFIVICIIHIIFYAFIHLHINILKPSHCLKIISRQIFCINSSRRIQISQNKAIQGYLFVYFLLFLLLFVFIRMFIYAFIYLHINILKPSQCLISILRQVFSINLLRRIRFFSFYAIQHYVFVLLLLLLLLLLFYFYVFMCLFMHLYTFKRLKSIPTKLFDKVSDLIVFKACKVLCMYV